MPEPRTPQEAVQQKMAQVQDLFAAKLAEAQGNEAQPEDLPAGEQTGPAEGGPSEGIGRLTAGFEQETMPAMERPSPTRLDLIDDAPPEALRLMGAAMAQGASPSDIVTILKSSGFVIIHAEKVAALA